MGILVIWWYTGILNIHICTSYMELCWLYMGTLDILRYSTGYMWKYTIYMVVIWGSTVIWRCIYKHCGGTVEVTKRPPL